MGALGKVASEFIVCLFLAILSGYLLIKDIRISFKIEKFKQLIAYALPIVPHAIAGVILGLSAKYFINFYHGLGRSWSIQYSIADRFNHEHGCYVYKSCMESLFYESSQK
ncbi:MAG: hypothetical protein U5L09_23015 [Bacteroidales bacterium]|nr:hypothetical protein [Bacteroidales bacterium]